MGVCTHSLTDLLTSTIILPTFQHFVWGSAWIEGMKGMEKLSVVYLLLHRGIIALIYTVLSPADPPKKSNLQLQ